MDPVKLPDAEVSGIFVVQNGGAASMTPMFRTLVHQFCRINGRCNRDLSVLMELPSSFGTLLVDEIYYLSQLLRRWANLDNK